MNIELHIINGETYLTFDYPFARNVFVFDGSRDVWAIEFDEDKVPHKTRRTDLLSELKRAANMLTTLDLLDSLDQTKKEE